MSGTDIIRVLKHRQAERGCSGRGKRDPVPSQPRPESEELRSSRAKPDDIYASDGGIGLTRSPPLCITSLTFMANLPCSGTVHAMQHSPRFLTYTTDRVQTSSLSLSPA
jgi:hypothetical protein